MLRSAHGENNSLKEGYHIEYRKKTDGPSRDGDRVRVPSRDGGRNHVLHAATILGYRSNDVWDP